MQVLSYVLEHVMCDKMRFLWKLNLNKEVVLYRVYGENPVVRVPDEIAGYPVAALGAYCFSDRRRIPEHVRETPDSHESTGNVKGSYSVRELSGGFVQKVILPDTIKQIDNAAFFNCRNLQCLEFGKEELAVGSDVFNNCMCLSLVKIRAKAVEGSSLKQILGRISWDLEVEFEDAKIFYPEYYETYETIAPAHIFGLNMEGEGFRARQCFQDDRIDFPAYDDIFPKACAEESADVLAGMALNRLMAPVGLEEEKKRLYEHYLLHNGVKIFINLVQKRELNQIMFMWENGYIEKEALDAALPIALQNDWSEGAAAMMEWEQIFIGQRHNDRFQF